MREYSVIGKYARRVDSIAKISGQAEYANDIALPQMLYGKMLRSPYPHAKILNIDTSKAEALPGVKAVVTGKDTGEARFGFMDTPRYPADQCALAIGKVRYVGEGVAAVAAIDEYTAERALDLIEVEYEPLPAVFDPEEAMKDDAPQVHEGFTPNTTVAWQDWGVARTARPFKPVNNICSSTLFEYGDIEKGFSEADHIREDRFSVPATSHMCGEPHAVVASFNQLSGKLDVWMSRQDYETKRYWLAKTLGILLSKVRIHKTYVGGAFGGKLCLFPHEFLAAFLSKKTGRPVKINLTRDEVLACIPNSHRMIVNIKTGVKRDGAIVAQHCRLINDAGAYRGSSATCLFLTHSFYDPMYDRHNVRHEATGVYTNKNFGMSKRGHGMPQMGFAIDSHMDLIAADLGIDPVELRLKNLRKKGDVLVNGDRLDSYGLPECIRKAAEASGWKEKWGKLEPYHGIGMGLASMFNGAAYWPFSSSAIVRMNHDGTATLYQGGVEFGQGQDTTWCMMVAEELGISHEDVVLISADSELCPVDFNNWMSAGMYVSGEAVRRAAHDTRQQLLKVAAEMLEAKVEDLEVNNGSVYIKTDPERKVTLPEVMRYSIQRHGGDSIIGKGFVKAVPEVDFAGAVSKGTGRFTEAYSFTAAVAEVEVDKDTGRVKVIKITVGDDCGFELNPLVCEGQLQSQVVMGMGDALFEEVVTEEGRVINPSLVDYEVPRALDVPQIVTVNACDYEPKGPYGGKEVGECARAAVIAAIANAVCNAIGARIYSLPMTPDKILEALRSKGK